VAVVKNTDGKPICGATIEVRYPGQRYVYSRSYCRRRVRTEGDRCHLHRGSR
jgi:hypothetical protein